MNSELQTLVSLNPLTYIPDEAAQEIISLLRSGIEAAKNGKRDEAKALLFRVTDIDPDNEMAWLWLASVSEYPEELLTFLQKVLFINPENEQALEWEKSTKALLARNLVQYGITAVQENKKESAKRCFVRALETDPANEMAWLWMASITEDQDEKNAHLQKVLEINPENEVANTLLKIQRRDEAQDLLQKSKASAVRGNRQEALEMLEQIKQLDSETDEVWILQAHLSESFEEKAFCFNQALVCNPENEVARVGLASLESILQAVNGGPINGHSNGHDGNGAASLLSPELEEELNAGEVEEEYSFPVETEEETDVEALFAAEETQFERSPAEEVEVQEFQSQEFQSEEETEESAAVEEVQFEAAPTVEEAELEAAPEVEEVELEAAPAVEEITEEVAQPEAFFGAEDLAELEASFGEDTLAEPENAFSSASDDWNEPEEVMETEQLFDEITGDLDIEALPDEPFAPNFADSAEEAVEQLAAETAETATQEEASSAPEDTFAVKEVEEETQEIKAETFYFGGNNVEKTVASLEEEETSSPVAEEFVSALNEPAEEVNEEMQLSEVPAAAEQAPFAQMSVCPFCAADNNINDEVCGGCKAVLGLHNLDMLLSQDDVDTERISEAVENMEANLDSDSFSAEDYYNLGLACLNLKNIDAGLKYLQKCYILNSTNSFLKAQIDELAKRAGQSDGEVVANGHHSSVAGKTIMVVDDSATIRKLVSAKLEKHGHNVISAIDGMDALAKLEEIVPDLILLDITMPRLDGYQVCKLIRANDNTRFVPIVLISGKDGFFDKVRGKMCGSTTYITKPFGPEMLLRTVEGYFEN